MQVTTCSGMARRVCGLGPTCQHSVAKTPSRTQNRTTPRGSGGEVCHIGLFMWELQRMTTPTGSGEQYTAVCQTCRHRPGCKSQWEPSEVTTVAMAVGQTNRNRRRRNLRQLLRVVREQYGAVCQTCRHRPGCKSQWEPSEVTTVAMAVGQINRNRRRRNLRQRLRVPGRQYGAVFQAYRHRHLVAVVRS